jgi:hypothetical protein
MRVRSLSFRDRTVGDAGGCRLADALLKVRHERRRSCGNLRSVAARWRSPPVINEDATGRWRSFVTKRGARAGSAVVGGGWRQAARLTARDPA